MAVVNSFEDVKFIRQHYKDIVFGFIRKCQSLLPTDNIYYTIPSLVSHWCLLYFYIKEHFDPDCCGSNIVLSENNTIATIQHQNESVVMLRNIVESGVHRWKFQLIVYHGYMTVIGIFKTKKTAKLNNQLCFNHYRGKAYGFEMQGANTIYGDDIAKKNLEYLANSMI